MRTLQRVIVIIQRELGGRSDQAPFAAAMRPPPMIAKRSSKELDGCDVIPPARRREKMITAMKNDVPAAR